MVLSLKKLVLLMRSLNERAMGLNEDGKTKWRPKRVLVPWKILSRNREPRSSQSLRFIITLAIPHSSPSFCVIRILA